MGHDSSPLRGVVAGGSDLSGERRTDAAEIDNASGESAWKETARLSYARDVPDETMSLYDLRVTVERIEGRSVCGLAVGDYFEVTESSRIRIPEGRHFCMYALQSVLPLLPAKQRRLPDADWLEQDSLVACPDPDERVIMRIERLRRRSIATSELT
jgi:uncharacterized repeat protein (TIGR04076 family)